LMTNPGELVIMACYTAVSYTSVGRVLLQVRSSLPPYVSQSAELAFMGTARGSVLFREMVVVPSKREKTLENDLNSAPILLPSGGLTCTSEVVDCLFDIR
jgi:hypothetical protein